MASSTDALVADIRKYSADGDFKGLVALLQQQEESLAQANPAVLDTMIDCLDSSSHCLGVLAAL